MSLCAAFKSKFTPFLLVPFLSGAVAAATWFVTSAAGASQLTMQLATAGMFLVFGGVLSIYIARCMHRYACNSGAS